MRDGDDRSQNRIDDDQRYQQKCADQFLQPYGHDCVSPFPRTITNRWTLSVKG